MFIIIYHLFNIINPLASNFTVILNLYINYCAY